MSETDRIAWLKQENEKLKRENELLMKTVIQISRTVNRLIDRYVSMDQGCGGTEIPYGITRDGR